MTEALRIAYNPKTGEWGRENPRGDIISRENLPPLPGTKFRDKEFTLYHIGAGVWLSAPNGHFRFSSLEEALAFYQANYLIDEEI